MQNGELNADTIRSNPRCVTALEGILICSRIVMGLAETQSPNRMALATPCASSYTWMRDSMSKRFAAGEQCGTNPNTTGGRERELNVETSRRTDKDGFSKKRASVWFPRGPDGLPDT